MCVICHTIAICVDLNRIVVKTLHITIRYTFYLAVRNVELQIVSRFVTGVPMFEPIYNQS